MLNQEKGDHIVSTRSIRRRYARGWIRCWILEWISLMVVKPKKIRDISICVNLCSLNATYVRNPFSTCFIDEVLENVGGCEAYSFTDGFSGYHQVQIVEEDQDKSTFVMEWGSFSYTVMPFGLKNVPMVFSMIVVTMFKDFINKLLEV
jgi:hypothetical protein